jgi:UDP-glucose 4-epimerase
METAGVKKFVFSSTAAVYGMPDTVPISESVLKNPINPYGETKLAVERMCHWQCRTGRMRYAALRYFNACGAGLDGTLGEDHRPESHLIPLIIQAAMGRRDSIKIFGTDYPTPDGTCVRDYIHIEDLCKAHLLALTKLDSESELVYNLGNGTGYSVRQVIEAVRLVSGRDIKVKEAARRPGDPPVLTADAAKACRELGWKTDYPSLESIVQSAWKFHTTRPDGYGE